ncbi:phosphodiester glycosidase family protein [Beijerinckia indica]|nr:phosphodiester glycosidase family protein [Beijerinckia indica]
MFIFTKLLMRVFLPLFLSAGTAWAEPCLPLTEEGINYVVCRFDTKRSDLRLFWQQPGGQPYGGFAPLRAQLQPKGETLEFAMNAGMFQEDLSPVGLYIQEGRLLHPANMRNGPGNFHMKPNGIFYFSQTSAGVMETGRFLQSGLKPDYATQSGPLLVANNQLHPKIEPTGTSEKIRNGVGVRDNHEVIFAISEAPVTFFRFARLFRDRLHCPDALFLDGSISSLYAPSLNRDDQWRPIGPIVGAVSKPTQGAAGK